MTRLGARTSFAPQSADSAVHRSPVASAARRPFSAAAATVPLSATAPRTDEIASPLGSPTWRGARARRELIRNARGVFVTKCADSRIIEAIGLLNELRELKEHRREPRSPGRSPLGAAAQGPASPPLSDDGVSVCIPLPPTQPQQQQQPQPQSPRFVDPPEPENSYLEQLCDGGWRMRLRVEHRKLARGEGPPQAPPVVSAHVRREPEDLNSALRQLGELRGALRQGRRKAAARRQAPGSPTSPRSPIQRDAHRASPLQISAASVAEESPAGADATPISPRQSAGVSPRALLPSSAAGHRHFGQGRSHAHSRLEHVTEQLSAVRAELTSVRQELADTKSNGHQRFREQLKENDRLVEYCASLQKKGQEAERWAVKCAQEAKEATETAKQSTRVTEELAEQVRVQAARAAAAEEECRTLTAAKRALSQLNEQQRRVEEQLQARVDKLQQQREASELQWGHTLANAQARLEEALEIAQEAGCYIAAGGELCKPFSATGKPGRKPKKRRKQQVVPPEAALSPACAQLAAYALRLMTTLQERSMMQMHDFDAVTLRSHAGMASPSAGRIARRRSVHNRKKSFGVHSPGASPLSADGIRSPYARRLRQQQQEWQQQQVPQQPQPRGEEELRFDSDALRVDVDINPHVFARNSRLAHPCQRLVSAVGYAVSELVQDQAARLGTVWHLLSGGASGGLHANPIRALEDVRSAFHAACRDHIWYAEKVSLRLGEALRASSCEIAKEERQVAAQATAPAQTANAAGAPAAPARPGGDNAWPAGAELGSNTDPMERYLELGQLVVHTRQQVFAGLSAALARLSELGVTMTGKLPPQPQVDSRSLGADALMATPGPAEAAVQGTLDLVTRFRELLGKPAPGKGRGKPRGTMSAGPSSAGPESSRMGTDSPLGRLSIAADGALGSTSKPGAAPPLLLRGELPPRTESMYGADVSRRKSFTHGEAAEQLSPRSVPIGPAWKPDRAWVPAGVGSGDWDDASIKQERRERASKGRLSISLLLRDNNDGASVCSTGPPHSPADQTRRSSAGSSAAERDSPSSVGRGKGISLAALGDIDLEQSSLAELRRVAVDVGVPEDRVAALDDRGDLIIAIKTMAANTKKQRTEKWVQQQGDGPPRAAPLTPRGVVTPRSRKTSAGGAEHDPFAGFAGVQLRPPVPATAVPGKGHTQAPQRSPRPKQEGGIVGEKGGDAIVNLTKQAMLGRGWLDGVPQVATEAEQRLERERGWRPATSRQDALSAGAAGIELRTAPLPRTTYEYRGRMTDYLGLPCSAVGPSPPAQQVHLRFGDGTLFHWEWRDVDLRDVPGRVMLRCGEAPHLDGVYCLPQGPPSGELERLVWSSGDRRLFCTPAGYWMVSETEQGPTQCSGRLQTTAPHDGRLPQHTPAGGWQIWDGSAWTDCSAELAVPEPYVMEGVAGLLSGAQEEFERLTVQEAKQRLVQRENAAGFSIVGPPDGQGKYEVHFRDRWEVMPKRGTTSYQKGWRVPAWESAAAAAKGGRARMRFRRSIHTIIAGNRFAGRRQSAPEGPAHRLAVASREAEQQKKRRATVAHDSRRSPSLRPSSAAPSPQRTAAGRRAGEAAHSPPRSPTAQLPPLRNPAPAAQQPTPQLLTLLSVDVVRSPSGQPVSPGVLSPYSALSGREDGVSDVDSMMPPADGDGEHDGLSAAPASDAPEGRRASHQKPRRQSAAPGARARQSLRRASAVTGKLASAAAKRSGAKGGD